MSQVTDLNDMKVSLAEQVVMLRETKHLVANLAQKFDGLSEKVIILGGLASEVSRAVELQVAQEMRLKALEQWKDKQDGAMGIVETILKSPTLGWLVGAAITAWAILTGRVHL